MRNCLLECIKKNNFTKRKIKQTKTKKQKQNKLNKDKIFKEKLKKYIKKTNQNRKEKHFFSKKCKQRRGIRYKKKKQKYKNK